MTDTRRTIPFRELAVAELGIEPEGLESAIRDLDSQIDLSLRRVFREPT